MSDTKKLIQTTFQRKIVNSEGEERETVRFQELDSIVRVEEPPEELTWETQVYLRFNNKCGGCGSSERLVVRLIVPEESGGQKIESNGVVLCRTCDLGSKLVPKPGGSSFDHPYNFFVSAALSEIVERNQASYGGRAAFLRHLIATFLDDPTRFSDLGQYQDSNVDVKINFHMASTQFEAFKQAARLQELSMTDALRGLLLMFKGDTNV